MKRITLKYWEISKIGQVKTVGKKLNFRTCMKIIFKLLLGIIPEFLISFNKLLTFHKRD